MRKTWALRVCILIYCLWSVLLILQKPGLQYDEAFLVAAAVHMRHPAEPYTLSQAPDIWICPFQHCLPLMGGGSRYVGAIKDYLALPLFALFGTRATVIRLLSMLLGTVGIWGVSMLVRERVGGPAAAAAALIIALNPAYVSMTIFDNNAVAPMMASLGLVCAALAGYLKRESAPAAFLFGLAAGFAVWTRANFVWTLAAGFIAALIVFRSRFLVPAKHWIAIACGGIAGGFPFLLYQLASGGGTWKAQGLLVASQSFAELLRYRFSLLKEVFLSDGEHRSMWGSGPLPQWQMWLFPIIVAMACLVCLVARPRGSRPRRADAQFAALSLAFLGAYLFLQRLAVAEHHLIVLVPLAAAVVTLAGLILHGNYRWGRLATIALGLIYSGSALYWQIAGIKALGNSGGIGMWSDAALDLARHIDQSYPGREIKILDWGYQANLYVLTDGRLRSAEIFSSDAKELSRRHLPWTEEIRAGGVFLLGGPDYRQFPAAAAGFSRAWAATRPTVDRIYTATQRDGATYAQLIDIEPNSIKGAGEGETLQFSISMGDPEAGRQLEGFYPIESGRWRWTLRNFGVHLAVPDSSSPTLRLSIQLTIPEMIIQNLGSVTLSSRLGEHALPSETYRQAGEFTLQRDLPATWLAGPAIDIQFGLDKAYSTPPPDRRELGIIVRGIAITPK